MYELNSEALFYFIFMATRNLALLIGEGNGTPLQHSCLENPMDEEAWWAVGHD